jgi:hypothetical protein
MALVLFLLVLFIIFSLPQWPHTRELNYGYYPSGGAGVLFLVLLLLLEFEVLPWGWPFGAHP